MFEGRRSLREAWQRRRIPSGSPKTIRLAGRVPFFTLVAIVLAYAGVMLDPPRMLLGGVLIYAASGPVMFFLQRARRARVAAEKKSAETR